LLPLWQCYSPPLVTSDWTSLGHSAIPITDPTATVIDPDSANLSSMDRHNRQPFGWRRLEGYRDWRITVTGMAPLR
jgi:hypothetical protein